uniref:Uncharacterized protein n=1 Tax=Rhizophora mucronata TaxID=61149 RepID=A0A2P2Q3B6_RHIMU
MINRTVTGDFSVNSRIFNCPFKVSCINNGPTISKRIHFSFQFFDIHGNIIFFHESQRNWCKLKLEELGLL